ncbi:hypothetical protein LPB140_03795 [Sphingorhabdus lutea]|uniref:TonB-dependent receptor plug domain-containing protein n=2 Tax=Sphingorhabdus lutea TaxID=1913578 RepID=A0A1L3JAD4_9SPHN|nr:hypothetical protein LPB140_03795 [Sphingorhabdus lutea]
MNFVLTAPKLRRMLICSAAIIALSHFTAPAMAQEQTKNSANADNNQPAASNLVKSTNINNNLQPIKENGRDIYTAEQFTRFAPQNALDMADQIPGFSIKDISNERGLGSASQNVLINGKRISGKSTDARSILSQIPAKNVIQLEIIEGSTLNIGGLSGQVLNLISAEGQWSGTFDWQGQIRPHRGFMWRDAEVNITGPALGGKLALGINNEAGRRGGVGQEIVTDANDNLILFRDRATNNRFDNPQISMTFNREAGNGNIFNLNASYARFFFRRNQSATLIDNNQIVGEEFPRGGEDEWNSEISTDYEFSLGKGTLKLIGYYRFEHSPSFSSFETRFSDMRPARGSRFERDMDESERIIRAEYRWNKGPNNWQFAGEYAHNFLDSKSRLFTLQPNGQYIGQMLPHPNSRVEENRFNASVNFNRALHPKLNLQVNLAGEFSEISQEGAGGLTRQFWRPKGKITLAYKYSPSTDINFIAERKVGQLDFGDFISSVDVQQNNNNAANPDLVPPQSWLFTIDANQSLGKLGSLNINFNAEKISDIVDQIPIGPNGEAPGNLPRATQYWMGGKASLLLDQLGVRGGKLDLNILLQNSRLRDPLLGNIRQISGNTQTHWFVEFRQDIPNSDWAWGASGELQKTAPYYRLNYTNKDYYSDPFLRAYIEHKDILGLKIRASLMNIANQKEAYRETFYLARRDGPIGRFENGFNKVGLFYRFDISGTF